MCDTGLDGDTCTVWSEVERTARKPHRCDGCRGPIRPGERYLAHSSLFDGSWTRAALCLPCFDARKAFGEAHPRSLIPSPEGLLEVLQECVDDGDEPSETSRWTPIVDAMIARGAVASG